MIVWKKVNLKYRTNVVLPDISLDLSDGRSVAIVGKNNCGKTTLAKAIAGMLSVWGDVEKNANQALTVFVPFHASLKLLNGNPPYRQQRWNNIDTESVPSVRTYLGNPLPVALLQQFNLTSHLDNFLICLSNGEMKKLELVKAMSKKPKLLVLDNAFTGLDAAARILLGEMIDGLVLKGVQVVLTALTIDEVPVSIKRFLNIGSDGVLYENESFKGTPAMLQKEPIAFPQWKNFEGEEIISLCNLTLSYGTNQILKQINWKVKTGERWCLLGNNGSGKTSLLNLIFCDNPKAYLFDIRLFGKQKGSGETIWDIKRRIGFISPEMHQYLPARQLAVDVVCSGFFDSEGIYRKASGYHMNVAMKWLRRMGIQNIGHIPFEELSTSAQRLVLFARALIKMPPLLILDEPFQGLDAEHITFLKELLDEVAGKTNCTMIFVTHHTSEIPSSFQHLLRLQNGEVAECY